MNLRESFIRLSLPIGYGYLQAKEPRQGSDRELHVHFVEVVVDDGKTFVNQRLENALIQ
jgi:hypothetical protein